MNARSAPSAPSDRRDLVLFFSLVYATTWSAFLLAGAAVDAFGPTPIPKLLHWPLLLIGAFAPSAVALLLTRQREGPAGVRALLARLTLWRVGLRWYLFALAFLAAAKLVTAALYRLGTGAWPPFGDYPPWPVLLVGSIFAALLGGPLGEEIGWRGYALPRLRGLVGDRFAALLLGVLWAAWHWPVFFIPGLDQVGQPLLPYLVYVTALSVAFVFLDRGTGGSLLLAVLFHTAINQSKDLVVTRLPDGESAPWALFASPVQGVFLAVVWIAAAAMLLALPGGRAAQHRTVGTPAES